MSLAESKGQLAKGTRDLLNRWGEIRSQWQDARAAHFEENCIHPLESEMRKTLAAMDHMSTVLQKIVKDCE